MSAHPDIDLCDRAYLGWEKPKRTLETGVAVRNTAEKLKLIIQEAYVRNGSKALVEKTPGNAFHVKKIREAFPNALVIYTRRNRQDNVDSLVRASRLNFFSGFPDTEDKARSLLHIYDTVGYSQFEEIDGPKIAIDFLTAMRHPQREYSKAIELLRIEPNQQWKANLRATINKRHKGAPENSTVRFGAA